MDDLLIKEWQGIKGEYFKFKDMNRVCDNANAIAAELGNPALWYPEFFQNSIFRYDVWQTLEEHLYNMLVSVGLSGPQILPWETSRTISYVDFNRVEGMIWELYQYLGGTEPRQTVPDSLDITLKSDGWQGTGPYTQTYDPGILIDGFAYVPMECTVQVFAAHFNALLHVKQNGTEIIIVAEGILPTVDIPVRIKTKVFEMQNNILLTASGWAGNGPWTQTVNVAGVTGTTDAVIGFAQSNASEFYDYVNMVPRVSAVGSGTVTVQIIGTLPTADVNAVIMWED